jgi:hypothetical protein
MFQVLPEFLVNLLHTTVCERMPQGKEQFPLRL